jgi:hypothetical protein
MNKQTPFKLIAIAFFLTLLLIIYFVSTINISATVHESPIDDPAVKDTIRFEILKNLLDLLLIVIAGGFIAYLFKSREETLKNETVEKEHLRNELQTLNEIRVNYFSRLANIYRTVKLVRRTLISGGLTSQFENQPAKKIEDNFSSLYLTQMQLLNESQLALEGLKIESKSLPALTKLSIIDSSLSTMEDYLRQILKEFESVSPYLMEGKSLNLIDLQRLDEFTSEPDRMFSFSTNGKSNEKNINRENYRFKKDFSAQYNYVINAIGLNLSQPRTHSRVDKESFIPSPSLNF